MRMVRCLCVQIFLRGDGKASMHFQHWEPSNPFVGNRSDEHSIPVIGVHDLAFFTSFLENSLKPTRELTFMSHWSHL